MSILIERDRADYMIQYMSEADGPLCAAGFAELENKKRRYFLTGCESYEHAKSVFDEQKDNYAYMAIIVKKCEVLETNQ